MKWDKESKAAYEILVIECMDTANDNEEFIRLYAITTSVIRSFLKGVSKEYLIQMVNDAENADTIIIDFEIDDAN